MAKLYTVKEAAEVWRVHYKTIYLWIQQGRITYTPVGRDIRIPQSQVLAGCPKKKLLAN